MARRAAAAIPAALRMTLLEWIEHEDDSHTPLSNQPACSAKDQALHARIGSAPGGRSGIWLEPIDPPRGLDLAPLG